MSERPKAPEKSGKDHALEELNAKALSENATDVDVMALVEHYTKEGLLTEEDIESDGSLELKETIYRVKGGPKGENPLSEVNPQSDTPQEEDDDNTETLRPMPLEPRETVDVTGATKAVPVIPPPGGMIFPDTSINPDKAALEPTVHMRAVLDQIGSDDTMAMPAFQVDGEGKPIRPATLPPEPKRPTPVPVSLNTLEQLHEDPELIVGPAAYITDVQGNEQSGRVPLLRIMGRPQGHFTIGSDPGCDIHIDFPGIAPQHGELKIEYGKMYVRGTTGAFIKAGGGAIAREWKEVEPDTVIRTVSSKGSNGGGPHSARLQMPHFRVNLADFANRKELRETLKARALKLRAIFDARVRDKGPDDKTAVGLMHMIDSIVAYNNDNNLGCFTPLELTTLVNYFSEIDRRTIAVRKEIEELIAEALKLRDQRDKLDKIKEQNEWDRIAAKHKREHELGIDELHLAPGEYPTNIEIAYKGPAFSFQNASDNKERTYFPADLLTTVTIGRHSINSHTMDGPIKGRMKDRVKNFMAEFYRDEEDEKYKVRYLEGLVQLQMGEGFMAPPQEIFELKPGQAVRIGNYILRLEEGIHGFSEEVFMNQLEGEKGIIRELLGQIRNQEHTTWEQDEDALENLCYILALDLPAERKAKLIQMASDELQDIYEELLTAVMDWEGGQDSGLFQTLILLMHASNEEGFFRQPFPITSDQLKKMAEERVARYLNHADLAYTQIPAKPVKPQEPVEPAKPSISRFRSALGMTGAQGKIYEQALSAYNEEKETYEERCEAYETERALYQTKVEAQAEALEKTGIGVVEIARFMSFGLITREDFEAIAPKKFIEEVERIIEIRELFEELDLQDADHLTILLTLQKMCANMDARDVFALEEISTRSLHCQVDLTKEPHLTGPNGYIHKLAQIHGSKAFERLDISRKTDEADADLRLINGLLQARIITPVELNSSIHVIRDGEQIVEKLQKHEAQVDSERTAAERKKNEELHAKLLAEEEAKRRDEYLKRSKDIFLSMDNAKKVDLQNPQAVEAGLIGMMTYAAYALDQNMADTMAGLKIQLPKKVEVHQTPGEEPNIHCTADELERNWEEYLREWRNVFLVLARRCAFNVVTATGLSARSGYKLLNQGMKSGFMKLQELGTPEKPIHPEDMVRGVRMEDFIQEHLFNRDLPDLSYLEAEPGNDKDVAFLEKAKAEITNAKLQLMMEQWRADNKKLFFERKIKKLQRRDARAIAMFDDLNPTDEERDLLQLK